MCFYAGLGNGQVLKFDKRVTDAHVLNLTSEAVTCSPVCSLQFITKDTTMPNSPSGLLVAQLDRLSFYEKLPNNEYKYHTLLIENNIMSCSYEPITKHVLISTRPSQKHLNVRNLVYEISFDNSSADSSESKSLRLNLIQTHKGSNVAKLLTRSKLFMLNSELYGCSSCEVDKSATIWNVSNGAQCCKLINTSEVIDVYPLKFRDENIICTLTEKQLRIFKQK